MLESLGVSHGEESVYLALVKHPGQDVAALARRLGISRQAVRGHLERLEDLGFLSRPVGPEEAWTAVRPDAAVNALVTRRLTEFTETQRRAQQLAHDFPEELRARPDQLVEIVSGQRAVEAQFVQLMHLARDTVRVLDRPPYVQEPTRPNTTEITALRAGVITRAIYATEAFEVPSALDQARTAAAAGEQARIHHDVPMKLAIADDAVALLPMVNGHWVDSALVIRAPMVVAALTRLFELLWQQGVPFQPADPTPSGVVDGQPAADDLDTELLALLATGLKDQAVARELGISLRTLGRRVAGLLDMLGASTRFQAGLQAGRRGALKE